ncbi:MAG: membrane-bound serine protease (ClpP class) [Verrucomicrobiales bacterium]|jgi:membrane-bound serine protease (ClpP class)
MYKQSSLLRPAHRLFTTLLTCWLATTASAQDSDALAGKVAVIPINEFTLIEAEQTEHLQLHLKRALSEGASAVILEIDSPGGFAISTRQVIEQLAEMGGVKTYAWIKGDAIGGPAMIALATDQFYFAPDTMIGSAKEQEIEWRGKVDALPDRLVEKTYADFSDIIRTAVAAKGRPAELVDGLIDPAIEVKLGDDVISEADDVLIIDDQSPLASGAAASIEELVQTAAISGEVVRFDYEPAPEIDDSPEKEIEAQAPAPTPEVDVPFGKTREESYAGKVVVIEIGQWTLMRKTKFDFMNRILDKAVADGAEAIIFDMDTPGGQLAATEELMFKLQSITVPTYTFVNTEASSAGSLIAIATDKIYMHRPSTLGSAGIVTMYGEMDPIMREKIESKFLDSVSEIARSKNRDPDLCRSFVKMELEYSARIPVISSDGSQSSKSALFVKEGELLSLSSEEAIQLVDGKPLLAEGTVQSIEELIEREGLKGDIVRSEPLGFEKLADFIVKIAPLLLVLALAGIYLEVNTPGFGIPGATALVLLGIFFFGHQAAGKLAGFEVVGVFLLGIALLIVELFILPGVFIIGAIGLLLIVGALLFAMLDKFDFSNFGGELDWDRLLSGLGTPITNLVIALAGAALLVVVLMRYLPDLPIMKKRMLVGVISGGSRTLTSVSGGKLNEPVESLVGQKGNAHCDLRPSGKGKFGDRILDVTADAQFIDEGTVIRIIAEEGSRIVVEQA